MTAGPESRRSRFKRPHFLFFDEPENVLEHNYRIVITTPTITNQCSMSTLFNVN